MNLSLSKHAIELILNCANPMLWSIYGPLSSKTILVAKRPRKGDQHQRLGHPIKAGAEIRPNSQILATEH